MGAAGGIRRRRGLPSAPARAIRTALVEVVAAHAVLGERYPGAEIRASTLSAFADDLAGLPPAWIMSCGMDKLRDDGVAYARALEAAGVPVAFQVLEGHVHPSFAFTRLIPSARRYEVEAIAALRAALHP